MPIPGEQARLLAGLLAAPGAEALPVLGGLAAEHPWLRPAVAELAALPLAEWQAEHGRLFINGHPRTPCLPFASAQRDGLMPGPSTERVAAFYRQLGLEADGAPADYLGTLLECAAWLDDDGRAEPCRALWQEHLLPWLPRYAAALEAAAGLELYRGLGRELAALCREAGHG